MDTTEVIVIGAGIAGLRCALALAEAGRDVVVVEAGSRVGGRQRTDRVDGFLLLEPFLAGVIADDTGTTSDAFVRLLVRMFVLGRPGLPADGIQALPHQLARRVTDAGGRIRLSHRASRIDRASGRMRVEIDGAGPVIAETVVVAVGPDAVSNLIDVSRPRTRGLQTWWFDASAAPPSSAAVHVDGRRSGPVINTVAMSHTVATYAPPGKHLVQATCLLSETRAPDEPQVRRHLEEIWGSRAGDWSVLRRDDIPHALPAQAAPLRVASPTRIAEGVFVAGDHRDTASIQGALVSGKRAARAVLSP